LIQANKDVRRFRHDFDNLKIALISHLNQRDIEAAIECLGALDESINLDFFAFSTGNPVADALLSEKRNRAEKMNVQLTFDGMIPPKGIEATDFCVILGNILDNALEACEKIETHHMKRWVSVRAFFENGFFFLSVENPVDAEIPIHGNVPLSTKSDKTSHGFGLYSVLTTAERYDGILKLDCKDSVWTTKIELVLDEV